MSKITTLDMKGNQKHTAQTVCNASVKWLPELMLLGDARIMLLGGKDKMGGLSPREWGTVDTSAHETM